MAIHRGEKKTQRKKRTRYQQTLDDPDDPAAPVAKRTRSSVLMHRMVISDAFCPELLRLLGEFLCRRCRRIKDLSPNFPPFWVHSVDEKMAMIRSQRTSFICPGSVVFLYMVCRDTVSAEVASIQELRAVLLTCLYVCYAYIGHEIGYPALPFIQEDNRQMFWMQTLKITMRMSHKMLHINISPQFFAKVFADLKNGADH